MSQPLRILLAILAAVLAGGLSLALDAAIEPALLAAAIGAAGIWFANPRLPDAPPAAPPVEQPDPALLDTILEAVDDPLLIVSRQIVTHANAAARALLGENVAGEDIRIVIRHPAAAERLTGRGDTAEERPVELVGLGDRERRWELSVHRVGAIGLLVRLADRSGIYAAERMRMDFVANASHELRTPLATLLGFIETLEDAKAAEDAPTRTRFLKIMHGEAKRMQQLVADLMSLSRIEADRFSAPQTALALAPLIAEVRDALHSGIIADRDRVLIEAAPDTPPVAGDRAQLSQLLHNVIGNALKYGRAGSPVRVSIAPAGAMVRLRVTDEGDGIAQEHLPRLTQRFYRVDPGRSRSMGGTGLGLAIVKHIVERHRGRLDIDSIEGHGTSVTIHLPVSTEPLSSNCHLTVTQSTASVP